MLPFRIELEPGLSPYRQIVYAATRAIVSGDLTVGAPFPSVRVLSQSLKVNPNTAQKAVAELVRDGLLEVQPGIGTVVADRGPSSAEERRALLSGDVERLVVEAGRIGVGREHLQEAIDQAWDRLLGRPVQVAEDRDREDRPA